MKGFALTLSALIFVLTLAWPVPASAIGEGGPGLTIACAGPAALHNPHCHPRHWHKPPTPSPGGGGSSTSPQSGSGASGGALCAGGCPWVAGGIGVILAMILYDEWLRFQEPSPACANPANRHQSLFGSVADTPKLWRPLCSNPISTRG